MKTKLFLAAAITAMAPMAFAGAVSDPIIEPTVDEAPVVVGSFGGTGAILGGILLIATVVALAGDDSTTSH